MSLRALSLMAFKSAMNLFIRAAPPQLIRLQLSSRSRPHAITKQEWADYRTGFGRGEDGRLSKVEFLLTGRSGPHRHLTRRHGRAVYLRRPRIPYFNSASLFLIAAPRERC